MAYSQITYLGHSAVRLTLPDERVILIDPWLQDNPRCPAGEKKQPRCDFIALTHAHFDHLADVEALAKQFQPKIVAVYELATILQNAKVNASFHGMNIGGTQELDGVRFSMTRAYHSAGYQTNTGFIYAGNPAGYVIAVPGLATVYHSGDTDVFSDMQIIEQLHAPKIIMIPIGDHFTMGPRAAALAASYFKANAIVPIHYATFPMLTGSAREFEDALTPDLAKKIVTLEPGGSRDWTEEGLA